MRQDGSVGLVTVLAVALVLPLGAAILAGAADLALTAARARSAADAAALAGMSTSPLVAPGVDVSPDEAARRVAVFNGAELRRSDARGWPLRYRVVVETAPRTGWVRRIVGRVREAATAAVRPRTPSAELGGV